MPPSARRRIIVQMGDPALMERLQALLESPAGGQGAPSLAHLETSLTDGYARALALEAERARVAKSIGVLAADDAGDAEARTRELSSLSRRLAGADRELENLRRTLQQLRSRATALRSARAPART
jgi:chromosome segregation ATPase